jgi:hypothetical protein
METLDLFNKIDTWFAGGHPGDCSCLQWHNTQNQRRRQNKTEHSLGHSAWLLALKYGLIIPKIDWNCKPFFPNPSILCKLTKELEIFRKLAAVR